MPRCNAIPPLTPATPIVVRHDEQDLHVTAHAARNMLLDGYLHPEDWACRGGLPDWVLLSTLLAELPVPQPPPAPTPPPIPDSTPVSCSKCGSTQISAHRSNFSVSLAILGLIGSIAGGVIMAFLVSITVGPLFGLMCLLLTPSGLLLGFTQPSMNTTCLRCGHTTNRRV